MVHDVVVFLGPTLPRECASSYLEALYLPPAEQGSIFRTVRSLQPRVVVLIDGAFAKVPAVRHKEILWALSRGTQIYGAASMGALRAAEFSGFGMKGYGLIYRWYRAIPFANDDEVAVAMTPPELGAQALSEALINMRITLRCGERGGVIPGEMRRALEDLARSIHFVHRTYERLFDRARSALPKEWSPLIERLERWVAEHATDQKQADAIGLLRCLAAGSVERVGQAGPQPPPFRMTEAWAADLDAAGLFSEDLLDD